MHFDFSKWEFFHLILVELHFAFLGSRQQPAGIVQTYESFLPVCLWTIDGHERRDSGQTTAEMHIFTITLDLNVLPLFLPRPRSGQQCWVR